MLNNETQAGAVLDVPELAGSARTQAMIEVLEYEKKSLGMLGMSKNQYVRLCAAEQAIDLDARIAVLRRDAE